jgi:hypothetical protein
MHSNRKEYGLMSDNTQLTDSNSDSNTIDTESMLSTLDNPYSPFTQFEEWDALDRAKGYNTCAYLARVAKTSDELSDLDQAIAIGDAIDSILETNVLGIYCKVRREDFIGKV